MNHKDRMSHPSDPKLTALALNLRKGIKLNINIKNQKSHREKQILNNNNKLINYSVKSNERQPKKKKTDRFSTVI